MSSETKAKDAAPAASKASKIPSKTLEQFRAEHDKDYIIPKRIQEVLDKLGNAWLYEVELLNSGGLSTSDFSRYREQFKDYYVVTSGKNPKRVWAGTKAFAVKLREMVP